MKTVLIRTEAELLPLAQAVLDEAVRANADSAAVLTLTGDLGAGKTAFTKALAHELGITEHVTSPTFVIMKSYPVTVHPRITTLTHIDAYRIEDESEIHVLGIPKLMNEPQQLIVIEWPERMRNSIPKTAFPITIQITEGTNRTITYGN